jgi:hypothetical protein
MLPRIRITSAEYAFQEKEAKNSVIVEGDKRAIRRDHDARKQR